MLLRAIEHLLYRGQNVTHAVTRFLDAGDTLTITVAPWYDLAQTLTAEFQNVSSHTVAVYGDEDQVQLPWDIIGIDAYAREDGQWTFALHCDGEEHVWRSSWPCIR